MNTRGKASALAYANVGVHVDVPIELRLAPDETEAAEINFGINAELTLDFADVASLELLRDVAAEGARLLRERAEGAGGLAATGVAP